MKYTLLQMTQFILNDMDSDEVNAIDDTIESQQVASIIKQCYFGMIGNRNWPHLRKLITLDSSTDLARPTYLRIPENLKEMEVFRYDKHKVDGISRYDDVRFLYPDHFLKFVSSRNNTNEHTITVEDFSGVKLYILNNVAPSYWTSFDDSYIVCDSYDVEVDSTLQSSKTQVVAYLDPTWDDAEDFVPDLPAEAFTALLEESKSTAFLAIKQSANQKAEANAQKQQRWLSRKAWATHGGVRYQNYGRVSRK